MPFRESAVAPVKRTSAKALLYDPTMKSALTSMICFSVGFLYKIRRGFSVWGGL